MTQARLFTPVLIAGCVILLLNFALRASFGVFQLPIAEEFGWPRAEFSLAIAIQNLAWGIGQPLFGAVAERFERELHIDEPETVATPIVLEAVATEPKVADAVCETAETIISSELARPMWAVVSFERVEVSRLTYAQAVFVMNELTSQGASGLCIITDEAARRIARS